MRGRMPFRSVFCYSICRSSFPNVVSRRVALLHLPLYSQHEKRCHEVYSSYCRRSLSSFVDVCMDYEKDRPCDNGKVMEKDAALRIALSQIASDFDRESNLTLHRFYSTRKIPTISTGSLKLDRALGIGGLPMGRMVEIYGKEASGKTTIALHIVKEAQKLGGNCVYLDVENAVDPFFIEVMGIDTNKLLIASPNSAENSLSMVHTLVNSGAVDVIVVDSVAALVPQREIDSEIDMGAEEIQSRIMTQGLRKINYSLCRSQTIIVLVNQVRSKMKSDTLFVPASETTCGGNAIKFYSAVRLRIRRDGLLHNNDEINGIKVEVEVTKNLFAPAMKTAKLDIRFGHGICRETEILQLASEHGIISRSGDGYVIMGEFVENQREAELYLSNKNLQDEITHLIREQLQLET